MENRHRTYQRQSMGLVFFLFVLVLLTLLGRLFYLMIGKADYYGVQAKELHERERKIKGGTRRNQRLPWQCVSGKPVGIAPYL